MIDFRYEESVEDVKYMFDMPHQEYSTIDGSEIDGIENAYFYASNDDEPNMFYDVLAVAVYEAKHNILSEKIKNQFIDYADRFDKGEFQPDMMPEDIPIVAKDIEYVRSKLKSI